MSTIVKLAAKLIILCYFHQQSSFAMIHVYSLCRGYNVASVSRTRMQEEEYGWYYSFIDNVTLQIQLVGCEGCFLYIYIYMYIYL